MESVLCASLHVLDDVDCNMPCVCENAFMSVYPHACDDMLHDSLGVVKISNVKLLKKKSNFVILDRYSLYQESVELQH